MPSKQELIQAQRFSRRRLLTAFTSGAPGGRELVPAKPMRGVALGVVLAVLVAGGSLLAGLFTGTLPEGWKQASVVLVKGEGTRYAVLEGRAYPVLNMASARLATGTADVLEVTPEQLDEVERMETPIGIADAPDALPAPDRLITGAWITCVTDGGVATRLSEGALPSPVLTADIVQTADGRSFYVAGTRRHEIPDPEHVASLQTTLRVGSAREVPATWLNLLTQGSELHPVRVEGAGQPATGGAGEMDLRIGQLVETHDGGGAVTAQYVVGPDSKLIEVTPFERDLYVGFLSDQTLGQPQTVTSAEVGPLLDEDAALGEADWPTQMAAEAEDATCVRLDQTSDGPIASVAPAPADLEPGVAVDPGRGAVVRATTSGEGGQWGLVTETGRYFPIASTDDLQALGYAEADAVAMPKAWAAVFELGPELSQQAAQTVYSPGEEEG